MQGIKRKRDQERKYTQALRGSWPPQSPNGWDLIPPPPTILPQQPEWTTSQNLTAGLLFFRTLSCLPLTWLTSSLVLPQTSGSFSGQTVSFPLHPQTQWEGLSPSSEGRHLKDRGNKGSGNQGFFFFSMFEIMHILQDPHNGSNSASWPWPCHKIAVSLEQGQCTTRWVNRKPPADNSALIFFFFNFGDELCSFNLAACICKCILSTPTHLKMHIGLVSETICVTILGDSEADVYIPPGVVQFRSLRRQNIKLGKFCATGPLQKHYC